MGRLGILHVPYSVIWLDGEPYSVCEDLVTAGTELIPAWRILKTQKKNNSVLVYQHFVHCCETLGICGTVPFLDRMMVLDYVIANEDRHFNNFGVLRDAETLEWIGFAPIFDSGSSLGFDKTAAQMASENNVICKPFKSRHIEQLKLVSDLSWIDFDRLKDAEEIIKSVLLPDISPRALYGVTSGVAAELVGADRIGAVAAGVMRRIEKLSSLAAGCLLQPFEKDGHL